MRVWSAGALAGLFETADGAAVETPDAGGGAGGPDFILWGPRPWGECDEQPCAAKFDH